MLKIRLTKIAVGVGLGALLAGSAVAAPVTDWDYVQEFGFVAWDPDEVVELNPFVYDDGEDGYAKLEWGTGTGTTGPSSLVVNATVAAPQTSVSHAVSGSIATSFSLDAVTFEAGPSVTHNNFPITGDSLLSAIARDLVMLTPTAPPGGAVQTQSVLFDVKFRETPNAWGPGNATNNCSWNTQEGVFCDDIFVLEGLLDLTLVAVTKVGEGPVTAFLIDSFVRDGYKYDVLLREETDRLAVLTNDACAAAGVANGCVGFVTGENLSTRAAFEFAVVATQVPEPGVLALLGIGLLGLGAARRKAA